MKPLPLLFAISVATLGGLFSPLPLPAATFDVYVTTSERTASPSGGALVRYQYDSDLNQFVGTPVNYNYTAGNGPIARDYGALSLSGDGQYLAFTTYDGSTNYTNTFNLNTTTLANAAQTPRSGSDSTYRSVWSSDGSNFWAVGNNNGASPAYFGTGTTTPTLIRNATAHMASIGYFNDHLFMSRNTGGSRGVWMFNDPGLPTTTPSSANTTLLSGDGWGTSGFGGFAIHNIQNEAFLFVTNSTNDTIDVFANTVGGATDSWDLQMSVSTVVEGEGLGPLQLSLFDTGDDDLRLFFTSNTADSGSAGTSIVGSVAWGWNQDTESYEFGTVSILESSDDVMFSGVVAVIPEPGSGVLVALGLAFLAFRCTRRRVARA